MHLIVALGNVGSEYELTRHNFGFLLLDKVIDDYKLTAVGTKFKSEVFSGEIAGKKVLAIKPQTFMNLSGIAASQAASFYKISPEKIIVLHDDLDLELGKIKTKIGGGHAGHNGLKSLDEMIGKNYARVRLGIGRPQHVSAVSDYVLAKFHAEEMKLVCEVNQKISKNFSALLEGSFDKFLNGFHAK
jgi:PTH1 family peptidyl-tRNA hydrolase